MKKLCTIFLVLLMVVCAVSLVACDCKHEYADWSVTTAPTCEQDGVRTRYCRKCDHAETETIPAGHTLTVVAGVSASCNAEGTLAHDLCTACNKIFIDGVEKTAADLVIPKTEHKLLPVNAAPASCHEDGVLAHLRCDYCGTNYLRGEVISDEDLIIPATHRTMDVPAVEKTCTAPGSRAYTYCYDCGACFIGEQEATEEELRIPAGHDLTDIREVAATCEEDGVRAHGHCETCGADVIDGVAKTKDELRIPATGHEYGSLIEETGKRKHYHCDKCGSDFDEGYREITKLDETSHVFGEWHEGTPATCTTPGRRGYYQCTLDPACAGFYYDVNYDYIGSTEDCLVIPAGHHYETRYNHESHMSVCTKCGDVEYTYSHSLMDDDAYENVYEIIGDHVYWHCKCAGCGYAAAVDRGPALTGLFVDRTYIIGVDTPATFMINRRTAAGNDGALSLNQYLITPSFYDFLNELEEKPASDFPIKKTFTFSYLGFSQEIEITFDIERLRAFTEYPVYVKGNIDSLDDIEIVLVNNNGDIYRSISLADCEDVDNGGFDVDADLTAGDKTYILKFTYDGKPYECSFAYAEEQTPLALADDTVDVARGGIPMLSVYYTSGGWGPTIKSLPLLAFTIEEGTFDVNTLGEYTLTVSLGNYLRGTVTISVMDPKTIVRVPDHLTFPAGSPFMRVRVQYLDGTTGYEVITSRMVLDADEDGDGVALDLNLAGEYGITYILNGHVYDAGVVVYNPQNLRVVDMEPCGNMPLTWEYRTTGNGRNDTYELLPDMTGLYFTVTFDDGSQQTIQVTEDMISFDADKVAKAVAQGGSSSFYVSVTYRGYTYRHLRVIPALRLPHRINSLMSGGKWANSIFVCDNALYGNYQLQVCDDNYHAYFYIPLAPSMLYLVTDNEDGSAVVGDTPCDLAGLEKGRYRVAVKYGEADARIYDLCVFGTEDIRREISTYNNDFTYAFIGNREAILESLGEIQFTYREVVRVGRRSYALTEESISFDRLTLGDTSVLDSTDPCEAELKLSYNGAEYTLRFDLVPNLDLYAYKAYIAEHWGETVVVRIYDNGYYRIYGRYGSSVGQCKTVDARNGVIRLGIDDNMYLLDENSVRLAGWTASLFGEKYSLTPTVYTLNDMQLYVYTHDGISYADAYRYDDYYEEWKLETTYFVEINADGTVTVDGMRFAVGEENALSVIVEGKTQYTYSESEEDNRIEILFNDNGVAYITQTELKPGTGEVLSAMSISYEWSMEDNIISLAYRGYTLMTFKVTDGGLEPEQTIL